MKNTRSTFLALLLAAALLAAGLAPLAPQAAPYPPPQGESPAGLEEAVQQRLDELQGSLQALDLYDFKVQRTILYESGDLAWVWLDPIERASGEVIATEPGLALARLLTAPDGSQSWQILLPSDPDWQRTLASLPAEQLPEDVRASWLPQAETDSSIQTVYRGYYLPWASGSKKRLSGSIAHFLGYNSCSEAACRYAYDFADGSMFPLLASKGGTVKSFYDSCSNGDSTCTNYIVLEDRSTSPTTWQIYYHLAQGSIPSRLKSIGTAVVRGQYIGNVDDTGYSSDHHLHFHVTANLYYYTHVTYGQVLPWGYSVDIRFDDVPINDGVPRRCDEAANWPQYGATDCLTNNEFTSGNVGANPPSGELSLPVQGEKLTGSTVLVAGTARDDMAITNVEIIARGLDGIWRDVDSLGGGSPFYGEVDLCDAGLANGPVDVAARVWDYEGNVVNAAGVKTVLKNTACAPPPPLCTPGDNKVILYAEANYQGQCREFAVAGSEVARPNLAQDLPVGSDNAASIQVGRNVRAVLFEGTNYTGRSEALEANDPNLADNRIGADSASALKVQPRTSTAYPPGGPTILYPPPDMDSAEPNPAFDQYDSFPLAFSAEGGLTFQFELRRSGVPDVIYSGQTSPVLFLSNLTPGVYGWRARSFNSSGSDGSAWHYFTITGSSGTSTTPLGLPYTTSLDSPDPAWVASGQWHQGALHDGRSGWAYNTGAGGYAGFGTLTSPPVALPGGQNAYLRFHYRTDTESSYAFWDQRRLQISLDGGPFQDLPGLPQLQLDAQRYWMEYPAVVDLSAYAGHTVRIRFAFFAVDGSLNSGNGWEIDTFSISADPPNLACSESPRDDTLANAVSISNGQSLSGRAICPTADLDTYKFTGTAGQLAGIRVEAMDISSSLDPILTLLDSSGGLILENDDIVPYEVRDSLITARLPYSGTYYLRVRSWEHPTRGGPDQFYRISLVNDSTAPSLSLIFPNNAWMSAQAFEIEAEASDSGSGVAKVDFYYHSPDWQSGSWQLLGSDGTPGDGFKWPVDPAVLGSMSGGGIYVEAVDAAGNRHGDLVLDLKVDSAAPSSQMSAPPADAGSSTAFRLAWSGTDSGSGVDRYDLQVRQNDGPWQDWSSFDGSTASAWFLGASGSRYEFRARAVDRAGNAEPYPSGGEVSVTVENACTPDSYEDADDLFTSAPILPWQTSQTRSLCGQDDPDWLRLDLSAGQGVTILAAPLSGGASVVLQLFASDGTGLLASGAAAALNAPASLVFTAPETGSYYLKVTPYESGLAGTNARYQLWAGDPVYIYLPNVSR